MLEGHACSCSTTNASPWSTGSALSEYDGPHGRPPRALPVRLHSQLQESVLLPATVSSPARFRPCSPSPSPALSPPVPSSSAPPRSAPSSLSTSSAEDGSHEIQVEELWRSQMMSNVGRMEITGDGGMILTSCYTHGIQRFDLKGRNEGAYHLGGTTAHAVPDFTGRLIAVATTEGELFLLNRSGNVRWKTGLPRGPIALVCDPLGRSITYGMPSGEICPARSRGIRAEKPAKAHSHRQSHLERPEAGHHVSRRRHQQQRTHARSPPGPSPSPIATTRPSPPCSGRARRPLPHRRVTNTNRMSVFTPTGGHLGQAPEVVGVGRILRTAPGWLVAATDRQIVHLRRPAKPGSNGSTSAWSTSLTWSSGPTTTAWPSFRNEIASAASPCPAAGSGSRSCASESRTSPSGPEATTAFTTDDGVLTILDPGGQSPRKLRQHPRPSRCCSRPPRPKRRTDRLDHPGPTLPDPPRPHSGWPGGLGVSGALGSLATSERWESTSWPKRPTAAPSLSTVRGTPALQGKTTGPARTLLSRRPMANRFSESTARPNT